VTTEDVRAAFGRPRSAWFSPGVLAGYIAARNAAEYLEHDLLAVVGRHYWGNLPYTPEILEWIDGAAVLVEELRYEAHYLYQYGGN
jgi:hypothetical protein